MDLLIRTLRFIYNFRSRNEKGKIPFNNFAELERDFARKLGLPNFDWVTRDSYSPMNLPKKPLSECRVALVTSGGIYEPGQKPFAMRLSGDDSFRVISGDRPVEQLRVRHGGYDARRARQDLNCVFPLDRLRELADEGRVGEVAKHHISFMGYIPNPSNLVSHQAREAGHILQEDHVDLVLLAPA